MAELSSFSDSLNDNDYGSKKLPTGLNVLTILTIIWCCFLFLGSIWGFTQAKSKYDSREADMEKMQQAPSWVKSMIPSPEKMELLTVKKYENKLPLLLLSLAEIGLCFFGAIQMRKRKKDGYLLWLIGEIIPFIAGAIFIGTFIFSGTAAIIGMLIVALFILLYTFQRKHLIY